MPMYRKPKFEELEEKFSNGVKVIGENHSFNLTLINIEPFPTNILQYDWKVTLDDGTEFNVSMGSDSITFPYTRLERIIERLDKVEKYNRDYLANSINDKIDEIYRNYR